MPTDLWQVITEPIPLCTVQEVQTRVSTASTLLCTSTLPSMQRSDIQKLQFGDPDMKELIDALDARVKPPLRNLTRQTKTVRKLFRNWERITRDECGVVYRTTKTGSKQLIVPTSLRRQVLESLHDDMGHQAFAKTLSLVQARCYWPYMAKDVEAYCQSCERCMLGKSGKAVKTTAGSLLASKPLEILAVDFTVLEPSRNGLENVLVMTDVFTEFTQAIPTEIRLQGP